ncbi:hypothetical protein ALC57_02498, partial [Trachymyrmex cornetzi]
PVLNDIFRIKFCPLKPIYVVNYLQLPTSDTLQNEITFENTNEGKLFDACLDENNEDYEKRITTELLDKTNAFTYQNRYEREKISLSRDYQSTIYPTKLIKPNFIVDLMDTPGDFIPIGSPCSKLYISYY